MATWKTGILAAALALGGCLPMASTGLMTRSMNEPAQGYERFFSPAPHAFRFVEARVGEPARRGMRAERFELRHGDCGGSDCGNPRYRSEIRIEANKVRARAGKDIFYGWSFYNATIPAFERKDSLRLVFGQWTIGDNANPAIRLIQLGRDEGNWDTCDRQFCAGPERETGDIAIQLEDLHRARDWGDAQNDGYVCRLFDSQERRNRWTDITLATNFSAESDGYLRAWVNGELKCNYRGPILSRGTLRQDRVPEHRRGIYASYTKRWEEAHPGKPKPTLIAYYDEFRVGETFAEVDVRAREIAGADPVD